MWGEAEGPRDRSCPWITSLLGYQGLSQSKRSRGETEPLSTWDCPFIKLSQASIDAIVAKYKLSKKKKSIVVPGPHKGFWGRMRPGLWAQRRSVPNFAEKWELREAVELSLRSYRCCPSVFSLPCFSLDVFFSMNSFKDLGYIEMDWWLATL